jgi:hypothetical protein
MRDEAKDAEIARLKAKLVEAAEQEILRRAPMRADIAELEKKLQKTKAVCAEYRRVLERVYGAYLSVKDRPQSLTERMIEDVLATDPSS